MADKKSKASPVKKKPTKALRAAMKSAAKKVASHRMGQPSKYTPEMVERIVYQASEGATDAAIQKSVGISHETMCEWKRIYPEFVAALNEAKRKVDELVVSALMQRARGYSHPAEKILLSKTGKVIRVKYIEHYPPDTTACIFWLKNRDRINWRDVSKFEVANDPENPVRIVVTIPSNGREAS